MKNLVFVLLFVSLFAGCKNNDEDDSSVKSIGYGTAFGMCYGYCIQDFRLNSDSIVYSYVAHNNILEPVVCSNIISKSQFYRYADMVSDDFFDLNKAYGCPDCADGGAEWLEVELLSGKKHKVVFEYLNPPTELQAIIAELRELKSEPKKCDEIVLRNECLLRGNCD